MMAEGKYCAHAAKVIGVLVCAGLMLSCTDRQSVGGDGGGPWFYPALSSAPSVIRYSRQIRGEWSFLIDHEEVDYVIVAVGEDMPDHFTRGMTAKVLRNGAVYIQENNNGDESWRLDRPK